MSASVALLGVPTVRASTLYDVQFNYDTQQSGAAVVGSSGDYWNFLPSASGSTSLLDAGGGSSGVSFTWSANGIHHFTSTFGGGNAALMGGYVYASSAHGVSFSGLPASEPYTLYIYSQSDISGRKLSVTVKGTTYTTTPSAFPTYFIAGQNYLAIPGVTDGSGDLSLTYDVAAGEANLNGMQLIMGSSALAIATQPTNQATAVGGAVALNVTATGLAPLSYQWFKNGGMVLGATNSELSVASVDVTDSGVYYVVVTNASGLVISQPVTVAVGTPQLLVWGANDYGQLGNGTTNSRSTPESVASNVVIAAVGAWHSLYLQGDGILRAMGRNNYGQLGDGTTTSRSKPVSVASNVVAMAAGRYHSLYLKGDGTLWGVGVNNFGQLGDGTGSTRSHPVCVASNAVAVAAGASHSLYLQSNGTLWSMGYNSDGQLGNGTVANAYLPESVASNVVAVAAGEWHSLYLQSDGTLWAMGDNGYGQLGNGTTVNRSNAVSVASNVVAMAAGGAHSFYLQSGGRLWAMGENIYGQLGDGTSNDRHSPVAVASDVVAVTAGSAHSLYVKSNGTVWATGFNATGELGNGNTTSLSRPVQVLPDLVLAAVVSSGNAEYTMGVGAQGPPRITSPPASQLAMAGNPVTFTVAASGIAPLMYQWQFNGTNLVSATNASYPLASVALRDGGSYAVIVTGPYGSTLSPAATLTVLSLAVPAINQVVAVGGTVDLGITATGLAPLSYQWFKNGGMVLGATNSVLSVVSAGVTDSGIYYVVVTNAGGLVISQPVTVAVGTPQLLAWGANGYGQLGDGTTTGQSTAVAVASNVVAASVGYYSSLYLQSDGTLWAMGDNSYGQLGDGTTFERTNAVSVASNVVAMAMGSTHALYLQGDGTLWAMGDNSYGQLGDGTTFERTNAVSVASNVVAMAAGEYHSLFVKGDGTLWAMGLNVRGQLGDGTWTQRKSPVSVAGNVVAVTAGGLHSLYLQSDGTLWSMGYNSAGQLGNGTATSAYLPVSVANNVVAVAAGYYHSLYLKADSSLWAMGANSLGQLGDGTTLDRSAAISVASNVVTVAAGNVHSLYLRNDGTLWAMGDNSYGQLGDGTMMQRNQPVSVLPGVSPATVASGHSAKHTLAVGVPQPPVITSPPVSQTVMGGSPVTFTVIASNVAPLTYQWQFNGANLVGATQASYAIASAAYSDAGSYTVIVTGAHDSRASATATLTVLGPAIATQPASQEVAVGGTMNLSVTATGAEPLAYQWFKNGAMVLGATNSLLALASAAVPDSGVYYVAVTNADGLSLSQPVTVTVGIPQLLAWGHNGYGQLGDGTTLDRSTVESVSSNVVAAAAGYSHSLYLKPDGTLWAVGMNGSGQLGDGSNLTRTNAVSVASNVVAVAAGLSHSLFIKGDGTLWAMGDNTYGKLGDGTGMGRYIPVSVASNVVAATAGAYHSLYLKNNGTLWAMGYNEEGALGDGTGIDRYSPVSVASNVVAVAAGAWHSLFLKGDSTLWGMGENDSGQLGDGTPIHRSNAVSVASNVIAIAAGNAHSLYLRSDGTLWAMGNNTFGQLGDGATIGRSDAISVASNVVAMAAGGVHSLFLKRNGTLWAMGGNSYGQLGDGTMLQQNDPVSVRGMSPATVLSSSCADHTLAVGAPLPPLLAITSPPASQIVLAGSPVTFTVTASGAAPLTYQWQFNSTNLVSATNASYALASVAWRDAGSYTVVVTDPYSSLASATATLTVSNPPPPTVTVTVAAVPTSAGSVTGGGVYVVGSNAVLTATATNGWQFSHWNDGATNNPYPITVPNPNITYTATFAASAIITVGANPTNGGFATGGGIFLVGSTNWITAVASNGWVFTGWNDGVAASPRAIVVTSNLTCLANFVPAAMVTTVALPPEGGWTAGGGAYAIGSTATVTATATNGWLFLNWNGAITNNPWAFAVPSDSTVCTANFGQISAVTVAANPTNAGSVNGDGVYLVGSNAVLTATATNGWQFSHWNDGATNNPYPITVPNTNVTYTATFAATAIITVGANPTNGGFATGDGTFLVGSTNWITAVASNNWVFTGWNDGVAASPRAIVVTSNLTCLANFVPAAMVTTVALPPEGGWTAGDGAYAIGSTATVTATATNGWLFLNWNGTVINYTQTGKTNNPLGFRATSGITYTANFARVTADGFVYIVIPIANAKAAAKPDSIIPPGKTIASTSTASIIGYVGNETGTIIVPAAIEGVPVTSIETGAFWSQRYAKVVLPDSIESIATTSINAETIELGFGSGSGGGGAMGDLLSGIADGAFASAGEVLLDYVLPAAALTAMLAELAKLFSDLESVQASASPDDGGYCSGSGLYMEGTTLKLSAHPNSGWRFSGWADGTPTATRTITVPPAGASASYPANFTRLSTVTVVANPPEGGAVAGGGTYDVGTSVTLTATTNLYWKFISWNDGNTNRSRAITVPDQDITYTATFEELKLELEVEADPKIGGYAFGSGEYGLSEIVILSAIPFPTWEFKRWGPDLHILTNGPVPPIFSFIVTPGMLGRKLKLDAAFSTEVKIEWEATPHYAGSVEAEEGYEWPPVLQDLPLMTAIPADGWAFVSWDTPVTTNNTSNPFCPLLGLLTPFDFTVMANFTPTRLVTFLSSNSLILDWPTNQIGWLLQAHTNGLSFGVSNNWYDLPGTGDTNSLVVPLDPANRAVFYRLRQP